MGYRLLSRYRSELMGIAMLWVMGFHARDLDLGAGWLNLVRKAGFGGVDIFILVSAMGLTLSRCRKRQAYGTYMTRRLSRILPAYYTVMIPWTIFLVFIGQAMVSTIIWNATPLYYFVKPPGAFNWYISGILIFYALLPACADFLSSRQRPVLWTTAAIVLSVALCQILMIDGFWEYTDIFYRVPVFFLGIQIGLFLAEDRPLKTKDILFWAGILVLGVVYLYLSLNYPIIVRNGEEVAYLPECHLFLLTTMPMCLVICVLFEKLPLGAVRKALRVVGENSLEIYLINVTVIIFPDFLRGIIPDGPGNRIRHVILILFNLAAGVLLHAVVEGVRSRVRPAERRTA